MITQVQEDFEQQRADAFLGNMLRTLNGAGAALMISVGQRAGLFQKMDELGPATALAIANAAQCKPPYVREWLGAMVTYGVAGFDVATRRFRILHENRGYVARPAVSSRDSQGNARSSVWAAVEDRVVACLKLADSQRRAK